MPNVLRYSVQRTAISFPAHYLLINEHKFELLHYGKNTEIKQSTHYKTDANENIIEKSVVKDLGVFMANNAKFNDHIDNVAVKANHMTS